MVNTRAFNGSNPVFVTAGYLSSSKWLIEPELRQSSRTAAPKAPSTRHTKPSDQSSPTRLWPISGYAMKSVDIYDDHLLVAVLQNIKNENRGLTCFGGCFQVCVCMCVCATSMCLGVEGQQAFSLYWIDSNLLRHLVCGTKFSVHSVLCGRWDFIGGTAYCMHQHFLTRCKDWNPLLCSYNMLPRPVSTQSSAGGLVGF